MVLARIHDELRRYTERAQRLIHLLAAGDRHVEVLVTAEEQGRRADAVGMEKGIGDLGP